VIADGAASADGPVHSGVAGSTMMATCRNFMIERESWRNATTRALFDDYAEHRAQQMALVAGWRGERLAILGAGNCNDLDLATLAGSFRELHLFDIDAHALTSAYARQSKRVRRACALHEHDLTGVASLIERWRQQEPDPREAVTAAWAELAGLVNQAGEFDAVLSTCLLSQVAINLRDFFGIVPALNTALMAAITGHIVLAKALTKPGGTLLVTSDCITNRFQIHQEAAARGPMGAIFHLSQEGAAFPGTDPRLVVDLLREARFSPPELQRAWIWDLSEQSYLVYGVATKHLPSGGDQK